MITECSHGVVQCPQCHVLIQQLPATMKGEFLDLVDLVAAHYPKSKEAFDNLRMRIKEHWNGEREVKGDGR
jgi:hypothetical protein